VSRVGVVLVAAGSSTRIGRETPKQFQMLGLKPMFIASLEPLLPFADEVIIVVPAGREDHAETALTAAGLSVTAVVAGGDRRRDSVESGLAALSENVELVLIHDAARPFVTAGLIRRVLDAASVSGAAIPAAPVPDTVKRVEDGTVVATLDRSVLRLAQTPQAFRRDVIVNAYSALRDDDVTDEAAVVELAGIAVSVVLGEPGNTKITEPEDLELARLRAEVAVGLSAGVRVGIGIDCHKLVEGRPLVLGGISIPFDKGLDGHSDADVLTHAICDALLGAVAAGDIGHHFPPGAPEFKNISSIVLLERVVGIVAESGYEPASIDATVVAERPKLAAHIPAMSKRLAEAMAVSPSAVSIKATTTEGTGPEGKGIAITAHAVTVVRRRAQARIE
jgi:2-C-methyl-D-erythritol 4-phosphate cytidylyltransferase/2-C-methyl-D-erythritol 2,4-cyclodiphosphate synthase